MNYNNPSLSFDEAVKISDDIFYLKNPKFKTICSLLIPSKSRAFLFFLYYYFRWVDDSIDNTDKSVSEKKKFLEYQYKLVSSISSAGEYQLNFTEERFLYFYVDFAKSTGKTVLIDIVFMLLETMRQDIKRLENDGSLSESELQKYLKTQAEALYRLINVLLLPAEEEKYAAKFTIIDTFINLLWLKDIVDDFNIGYIDISREEIARFKLNTNDLFNDSNFTQWFSNKISSFIKMQEREAEELSKLPFRLKIFWFWAFPYSYRRILKVKNYNYSPYKKEKKKFLPELKIYFQTFTMSIRFFVRVFL